VFCSGLALGLIFCVGPWLIVGGARHLMELDTVNPWGDREKRARMTTGSLADVTERLFAEFEPSIPLTTIVATVRQCRHELDAAPELALPELVERLARQRLTELAEHPPTAR
jgi:hypothetical protein